MRVYEQFVFYLLTYAIIYFALVIWQVRLNFLGVVLLGVVLAVIFERLYRVKK